MRPAHNPFLAALLLFLATALTTSASAFAAEGDRQVVHQLRIYELFEDTREAFHDRFRDHAQRIMARYDFNILAMWESRTDDRIEFVYLLEWPDKETMKDRWDAFLADQEWSDIKAATSRIHGQFVGDIEDRTLRLTEYSPHGALLRQDQALHRPTTAGCRQLRCAATAAIVAPAQQVIPREGPL